MNGKQAKKLRALARTTAIECTEYQTLRPSAFFLGKCVLATSCVRAVYQGFKREYRAA